jgi:hypothetical protein
MRKREREMRSAGMTSPTHRTFHVMSEAIPRRIHSSATFLCQQKRFLFRSRRYHTHKMKCSELSLALACGGLRIRNGASDTGALGHPQG